MSNFLGAVQNNADFFKHQSSNQSKNGTDYVRILEDYNKETDFLSKMPDQKGMPIWEKMYAVETEKGAGIMIPLSHDNESMSSILFATLDGKNAVTGVKDYDNTILQNTVYNQKISVENREKFFFTFIFMDNRTFGNEHFTAIPNDLFVGNKYDVKHGMMGLRDFTPSSEVTVQQSGKLFIVETCVTVLHCTHHAPGICDACSECQTTTCTQTIMGTADDPFPTTPGGGGPTGGGGCNDCTPGGWPPNGPNVPENPCGGNIVSSVFYRPAPGCGGGIITDLDDPCEKTKNMLADPAVKKKVDELEEKSKTNGEQAFIYKKDGNPSDIIQGKEHSVDFSSFSNYKGVYHNHTPLGIKMFSVKDIILLHQTVVSQMNAQTANQAFVGMVATEACNCPPANFIYYNYIIRFNGGLQTAGSVAYPSDDTLQRFIDDYNKLEMELKNIPELRNGNNIFADLNAKGLEKLFFGTLQKMGINLDTVILQKIEKDGTTNNVSLNSDGTTSYISCP